MILHSFDYPPMQGGISRLCSELATGLSQRGVGATALTQAATEKTGSFIPKIPETRVFAQRPWREYQAFHQLRNARGSKSPVICGIWYPEGLLATLAGVRPRIVMAYGSELLPPRSKWRRGLWRHLQRKVLTSADLVIVCSEFTKRLAKSSAPDCRAVSVPLAVDHERFRPGDRDAAKAAYGVTGKRVILTVSRLWAYKGHEVVFRALAALPDKTRGQFTYLIAGRGPDELMLRELAKQLGVYHLVTWLGYVPEENLAELYRAADLFVLCTRELTENQEVEGFGLVFLEAQACGTPVVGTSTGGIPDAVTHGEGGHLIQEDDDKALSEIFLELSDNPASFHKAGDVGRRRVEREYTWESYFARFEQTLKSEGFKLG